MPETVTPHDNLSFPKAHFGEKVRNEGINVPQIYSNLEDARQALASGTPVIMRSESPEELYGPSGLRRSNLLTNQSSAANIIYGQDHVGISLAQRAFLGQITFTDTLKLQTIFEGMFASGAGYEDLSPYLNAIDLARGLRRYWRLNGVDLNGLENKLKKLGHSYWEYIPGIQQTVCFDSANDRIHVRSIDRENKQIGFETFVGENLASKYGTIPAEILDRTSQKAIGLSAKVRSLKFFPQNRAPMIETVTGVDGSCYYLQYHAGREAEPVDKIISRENNTIFARGAGEIREIPFFIGPELFGNRDYKADDFDKPFACSVQPDDRVLNEWLLERAQAIVIFSDNMETAVARMKAHLGTSSLFKAPISLIVPPIDLADVRSDYRGLWLNARIGADGTNGFFEIV